jgi:AcrR family transcriptional regulator
MSNLPGLWECPLCRRTFANRNQSHTCRPLGELDAHFRGKDEVVREIFDRIVEVVQALGPVEVLAEKTRIALHTRMSFAAFMPRVHWLDGHVVLAERLDSERFTKIEVYSPHNVLHAFRLRDPAEVDAEVIDWFTRAYAVGRQQHLR